MDSRNGCLGMIRWHYSHLQNDIHRCTYYGDRCDQGNSHCPHDKLLKQSKRQIMSNQIKTNYCNINNDDAHDSAADAADDNDDKDKQQHK